MSVWLWKFQTHSKDKWQKPTQDCKAIIIQLRKTSLIWVNKVTATIKTYPLSSIPWFCHLLKKKVRNYYIPLSGLLLPWKIQLYGGARHLVQWRSFYKAFVVKEAMCWFHSGVKSSSHCITHSVAWHWSVKHTLLPLSSGQKSSLVLLVVVCVSSNEMRQSQLYVQCR